MFDILGKSIDVDFLGLQNKKKTIVVFLAKSKFFFFFFLKVFLYWHRCIVLASMAPRITSNIYGTFLSIVQNILY